MDWKRRFGSQISLLIALGACGGIIVSGAPARVDRRVSGYEKELKEKTGALDSIKAQIDTRRKKLRELENVEGNYLARLEYLETNIVASRRYLALLSHRIDSAETTIVRLTDSLHQAQSLLADRQCVMKQRLRRAYMTQTASPPAVLLLSRNPLEAVHRVRFLEEVHRYDRELVGKIKTVRKITKERKNLFEKERAQLARLLFEKKHEQEMRVKEEASRRLILSDIRSKKKSNIAMIAELETAQSELNAVIKLLEEKRKNTGNRIRPSPGAGSAFGRLGGALPWPLSGPVIAGFGRIVHPLYKTVTRNNGIDIGAKPSQPVRCVANGTVIHTGAMRGIGKLVIVDHGEGFITIYAHVEEIAVAVNQQVTAGDIIGKAAGGETAETASLHFEIRRSTDALDPLLWLKKAK